MCSSGKPESDRSETKLCRSSRGVQASESRSASAATFRSARRTLCASSFVPPRSRSAVYRETDSRGSARPPGRDGVATSRANLLRGSLAREPTHRPRSPMAHRPPSGINGEPAYDIAVAALKTSNDDAVQSRPAGAALAEAVHTVPDRVIQWLSVAVAARV